MLYVCRFIVSRVKHHIPGSYLVMELTNRCNLACVHCAVSDQSHAHYDQKGHLDPQIASKVFADLAKVGAKFDSFILFWWGEPLLHPHFLWIYQTALRMAVKHQIFGKIEVHTNAVLLSQTKIAGLLNNCSVPQVIHFSLDAATRETYNKIKGRDKLDDAVSNAKSFYLQKQQRQAKWPRAILQYIVGSNNQHEVSPFRSSWEAFFSAHKISHRCAAGHVPNGEDAVIFFRQLDCPTPEKQMQENEIFRNSMSAEKIQLASDSWSSEAISAENLQPCSGFWKSPVIDWNGMLTTCTRDNELENVIGSLAVSSFSDLWWGSTMKDRRQKVRCGNYDDLSLCSSCFIPRSLNHATITLQEIELAGDILMEAK